MKRQWIADHRPETHIHVRFQEETAFSVNWLHALTVYGPSVDKKQVKLRLHFKKLKCWCIHTSRNQRPTKPFLKGALVLISVFVLSGCFDDLTDIKAFMTEVKERTPAHIEPIPAVKEFAHVLYGSGDLRSPFAPPKAEEIQDKLAQLQDCLQPVRGRVKGPLEKYALSNLKMKGTLGYSDDSWALVEAATDRSLHRVSTGNYMGLFHGRITAVKDDKVHLQEMVPDGTGCWKQRTTIVDMNVSEASDESK
jgi:type IV pilus assembly protein PilP